MSCVSGLGRACALSRRPLKISSPYRRNARAASHTYLRLISALGGIKKEAKMKTSYFAGVAVIILLICLAPAATAQSEKDDEVLRNFVSTRDLVVTRPSKSKSQDRPRPARPIGLGFTLFKRGPRDTATRVSARQEFRAGDAVRFMIESNISGYLYVFHVENDGPAKMIFPDARLQGGNNFVQAHVPKEVPSSREDDPEFRWFHFNQSVAIERFYLIVTRERLPDVLAEERLV